jgi:hypothetical protein
VLHVPPPDAAIVEETPASIAIGSTQPATIKLMPPPHIVGYIMSVGGHLAVAEAKPDGGKRAPAWRRLPGVGLARTPGKTTLQ